VSTQRFGITIGRVIRGSEGVPVEVVATGVVTGSVGVVVVGVAAAVFFAISIVFRLSYNQLI
jgi:hypothetical protein